MSTRFEEATNDVVEKVNEVIRNGFPQMNSCLIEVVMDMKKRKSGGRFQLIKLDKASPIVKHISADDVHTEGLDYILYIDHTVYHELSDNDKTRLISHGLYHADLQMEKDNPYQVRKPTVQTFYEEIVDNEDDPRWAERLDLIAEQTYEREAEANG